MYNQHTFDVRKLVYSTSRDNDYNAYNCTDYFLNFAIGKQARVEQKTETYTTRTINIPSTAKDWLKKLVIEFCPSLNFGWLTPTYKTITCKKKEVNHNTYWNVIPIDPYKKYRDKYLLTEVQWLTTMPYTFNEKYGAECKVKDLIYSQPKYCWNTPKQLAAIAVYKSFEEN